MGTSVAEARSIARVALVVALLATAAWPQAASQAGAPEQGAPRRRIVDKSKFPPKQSAVRKVFMAPVRLLNLPIEGVANMAGHLPAGAFGDNKDRLATGHHHLHKKFMYGGLGEGSGIGGGFSVSTADLLSRDFEASAAVAATLRRYFDTRARLTYDPTGGHKRTFRLIAAGRYQMRPQEDFSGIGAFSSEFDRTTFDQQERSARLGAELQPHRRVQLGAGVDYSSTSIFPGRDERFPTTQALFTPAEVPGLAGGQLFGPYASLELDARDAADDPRAGAWVGFGVADNWSVDRQAFAFTSYRMDGRTYLPLGTKRRVIAVRVLGLFNDPRGDRAVPFFRMARLGDYETLRGYPSYRFYGNNALAGSLEYRWQLVEQLRAFLFADFGQVFNGLSELRADNLRATFGGGFEARPAKQFTFRIFVGKSPQETRLFLKLNRGF